MANYYESARTNYFKVNDEEKLKEVARLFGADVYPDEREKRKGYFCLLWRENGFNEYAWDNETDEELEGSFFERVAPLLAEDSVLVVTASGAEKLRYVTGYAIAVDCTGETVGVNINQIYDLAARAFPSKKITRAEY